MAQAIHFGEILDAADQLSSDEQEALVAILHRRLAEKGRRRIAAEVREARAEFAAGGCREVTVEELMREVQP